MARASCIYIVLRPVPFGDDDSVIAAFTVKYEMEHWLEHYRKNTNRDDGAFVVRVRDNQSVQFWDNDSDMTFQRSFPQLPMENNSDIAASAPVVARPH